MATATVNDRTRARARRELRRLDVPTDYWTGTAPRLPIGEDEWQVMVYRGASRPKLNVGGQTTNVEWVDASAILEGTVTLNLPPRKLDITEGHVVVLGHRRGHDAKFREVWRMRISSPQVTVADGGYTLTLHDDLLLLQQSKDDFDYRVDKQHPHGWYTHEIIADIARRFGFQVGSMPKGKKRIKSWSKKNASPFDAITAVMLKEKVATGVKFRLGWRNGKLTIEHLQRSRDLISIGSLLLDATYSRTMKSTFATALSMSGTVKKVAGKKGRKAKLERIVQSRRSVERYGYILQKFTADNPDSIADAIDQAKNQLATIAKPDQELEITVPGSPTMRRGAAMNVVLQLLGLRTLVFAKEVRHSVSAGDYTMDVVCQFDDPYVDQTEIDRRKKCLTAQSKGRTSDACKAEGRTHKTTKKPAPKKAKTRADA